jgi:2-polyprenyl-6-methoxyphenol hydroxylase-like FAD-dependent oxidoreductase/sugar lactone lactonase YvrE
MKIIDCDVVIIGAGVAGSFLACNLKDASLRVVLVEQNKKIPDVNRGDQLAPCTVKRLAECGALTNLEKRGSIKNIRWQAIGPDGDTVTTVPLEATAPPPYNYILGLPHALIHEALQATASEDDNIEIIRGMRVKELCFDDKNFACGVVGEKDKELTQINARVVAGCDGPSSFIREAAGICTDIVQYPFMYAMLTCKRSLQQPQNLQLEIWGASGFAGLFPIGDELVRCPVQISPGEVSRWRKIGLDAVHAELSERFPYYKDMELLDKELHAYKILLHHADSYVADGVVLLGDAAHCTPPYYGMGMNIGMRDAHFASKKIKTLLKQGKSPDKASLLPYEEQCRTFNQFVLNASKAYGAVAAAMHKTMPEIRNALRSSPALDANVMSIIYADYDEPPPENANPLAVVEKWGGSDAIELNAEIQLEGLGYAEAPRWHDNKLWFVDFFSKQVMTLDECGSTEVIATVLGTPGGLGFLPNKTPVVVSQTDFKLMMIDPAGEVHEYADLSAYARGAANELLVDNNGRCYVGHHGFDFFGGAELEPSSLIMIDENQQVRVVAEDLIFPNGSVITEDGQTLIVAESFANRLTAFDIECDGSLTNRRVWAQLGKQWTPDGICLDKEGALWIGNPLAGAFIRVKEHGEITHKIRFEPRWAVACVLGGKEGLTLFGITAQTNIDEMPRGISQANIISVEVEVGAAGFP